MLVWVDIETTGLEPTVDSLLEVGMVVTDDDLNVRSAKSVVLQPRGRLIEEADPVVKQMHSRSGLWREVSAGLTVLEGEAELLMWLAAIVAPDESPMCGSSVHFDRAFLKVWMPAVERHFFRRNIDVSTIKELARRWYGPSLLDELPHPAKRHRAIDDILDTLEELRFYRKRLLVTEALVSH